MTDHATALQRNRWQLTDAWLPFPARRFPAGAEADGRLVRVTVASASSARFSERRSLAGASLRLPFLTRLAGEARLDGDQIRITVSASAFSVLLVGLLSGVFMLSGLHVFLSRPAAGTALLAGVLLALGTWILRQVPRVGREVAEDALDVLGLLAGDPGGHARTARPPSPSPPR